MCYEVEWDAIGGIKEKGVDSVSAVCMATQSNRVDIVAVGVVDARNWKIIS